MEKHFWLISILWNFAIKGVLGPSGGPAVCRSLLVTLLPVNMAVNGLWGTFFCYPTNMPE